jgi:multicomponent Na+:H+ antiporter subunit D
MDFICNFPFFSIMISMFSGIVSAVLSRKAAKWLNLISIWAIWFLSAVLLYYIFGTGEIIVYKMGHFPAPWGNEIRAGLLEAGLALFFCSIMLLSMTGGRKKLMGEVVEEKHNLYYILVDLMLASLLALIYTNDLFTAYVFVEINTISACGLIMIRQNGRTIEAAVRYMIMSLLGSGLLLMGICILYDITGHLLMSNIRVEVSIIYSAGTYPVPLTVTIILLTCGLAMKSALFPFHTWVADAYGYSTVSSAAILSSLVSKGYIILLIKIIYRVIGFEVYRASHIIDVVFVFGLAGMIMGSISAIRENDIRRMIAYSSVAQIGYIYMGIGLGTRYAMIASIFHILSHAATKSMLFIGAIGLTDVSKGSRHFEELTGSGYRHKIAGITFAVGSLSMVGIPLFSGFISKLLFAQAAVLNTRKMLPALIVLAISTILNAIYFMKTVIRIYTPTEEEGERITMKQEKVYALTCICFIALNIFIGMCSQPIVDWIGAGIDMFA